MKKKRIPWNKGLTKENDERVRLQGKNAGNTKRIKYASGELIPSMKGKHHSKKTKEILRITHMGKHFSPKTEIKKGQHLSLRTEFKKGEHASLETEFKKGHVNKILWNKGKTKETNIKLRELGKKVSFTLKRKYASGELIAPSKGKRGKDAFRYGKLHTDETKEEIGRKARENWENPSYRDKTVKAIILGSRISPNKKEKELEELLNIILPNEYKFVGDGKVIINGKCPDFISINGQKKIIELFGNFWHSNNKWFNTYNNSKERQKHFKDFGYQTLIVWECELLNKDILIEKIKDFSKK